MVLATNLIEFYVFFELVLLPSFFLISFFGYGSRHRTGLMFFFWTHAGSVVLLLGLLSIGFFAGGFDYRYSQGPRITNTCTMDVDYNFCSCIGAWGKVRWLFAATLGFHLL